MYIYKENTKICNCPVCKYPVPIEDGGSVKIKFGKINDAKTVENLTFCLFCQTPLHINDDFTVKELSGPKEMLELNYRPESIIATGVTKEIIKQQEFPFSIT